VESSAIQSILPPSDATVPQHHNVGNITFEPPTVTISDFQTAKERIGSIRYSVLKRTLDLLLSSVLILAAFPIFLLIAIAVKLTSPGPILYRERRIGRHGVPFIIYKFRSMHTKESLATAIGVQMTEEDLARARTFAKRSVDPRITRVGVVLRKWSLDELPQLFNVLEGNMSLVGPRPVIHSERELYGPSGRFYELAIPGISGLWQVSGRSDISFPERISLDCRYAIEWRLFLDLKILAKTLSAVVRKRGAY
jgi:exopolysaccharide production protein ExoY